MNFRFYIDDVTDKQIVGWIIRVGRPLHRCVVALTEGSRILARTTASCFHPDLVSAGIGDSHHAFAIPLPPILLDGEEHLVEIVEQETGIRLNREPIRWRAGRPDVHGGLTNVRYDNYTTDETAVGEIEPIEKRDKSTVSEDHQPVFSFEFKIITDLDKPVPIRHEAATLECSVRNLSADSVNGGFNLGIRLNDQHNRQLVHETRLFPTPTTLDSAWTPVIISIPRHAIEFGRTYTLIVDFIRKHECWIKGGTEYKYDINFIDVSDDDSDIRNRLDTIEQNLATLHAYINHIDRRVERAAAEIAAGGQELSSLRDALNDTVWRTERSYLGLSEGVADQAQRLREALERVDELASQTDAVKIALDSELERLRIDLDAGVARPGQKETALAGQLEQLPADIPGFVRSWKPSETDTPKRFDELRATQSAWAAPLERPVFARPEAMSVSLAAPQVAEIQSPKSEIPSENSDGGNVTAARGARSRRRRS